MRHERTVDQELEYEEITIDMTELLMVLWSKAYIILLSGILMALLSFVGTKLFITPIYTSVTKMYVLSKQDSNAGVTYSDLQTGAQLTKDYMELVKSRPVLEKVISALELDMEPEELEDMIHVATAADTRILSVEVESENPREAKEIADVIRESVGIQITEITDADAVNTVEEGNLPVKPSSPSILKNSVIGGMLGILIAIGIIVLIFVLDDTIKTPDDVEHYLGLNVLTSIPIQEGAKKLKKVRKGSAKKLAKNMKK